MRDLAYRSYYIGDFRIDGTDVLGRYGPEFPQLIFDTELQLGPYESSGETAGGKNDQRESFPYTVTDLTGDLSLKLEARSKSQTRPICRLRSEFSPSYVDRERTYHPTFIGRLTPHHVSELEKRRQGGDLHLQVSCELTLHFEEPPSKTERFVQVSEKFDVSIPRSHWTDRVYPKLGGREVFVIEIPKGKQSIEAAWSKIEDAKDAYQDWNQEGASIACREAVDEIDRAMKEHLDEESCTYRERWYRAFEGVKDQASLAGHLGRIKDKANCERPEELRVGQADLECLIIRTQSLLKYAEALLREKSES